MKIASLALLVVALPLALGCTVTSGGSPDDEPLGTTAEAFTYVDRCATIGPNAIIDLSTFSGNQGKTDSYTRTATTINETCPLAGNDRPDTIVEFDVDTQTYASPYWHYYVAGEARLQTGTVAKTQEGCQNESADFALYYFVSAGNWKLVGRKHAKGQWSGMSCIDPHVNWTQGEIGDTAMSSGRLRLHGTGIAPSGDFAPMTMWGSISSPYN